MCPSASISGLWLGAKWSPTGTDIRGCSATGAKYIRSHIAGPSHHGSTFRYGDFQARADAEKARDAGTDQTHVLGGS